MIYTCSEDQDNLRNLSKADTIARESQQPTNLKESPAYFTVNTTQQKMFTMSADLTYSTINEDNQQNVRQDNPAYFSFKRSVAALNKCEQAKTII